jgi:hypothetical protein
MVFKDLDNDVLKYIAYFSYNNFVNQELLKETGDFWLKFDSLSRRFYGQPVVSNISTNASGKYEKI